MVSFPRILNEFNRTQAFEVGIYQVKKVFSWVGVRGNRESNGIEIQIDIIDGPEIAELSL
jgi:hypothetical protein